MCRCDLIWFWYVILFAIKHSDFIMNVITHNFIAAVDDINVS